LTKSYYIIDPNCAEGAMPIYPDIDPKTGTQKRIAGKAVWRVHVSVKGAPRYRKRHYGTRTEVLRQEARIYEERLREARKIQSQNLLDPTFEEFADWYVEYKRPKLKDIETTIRRIRNIKRYLLEFCLEKRKLSEFTTEDVERYMDWRRATIISSIHKKPPSEVTIKRDVVCWKAMINVAVKRRNYFINYNYVSPIELVKEKIQIYEGMTVDQFHKLIDAAPKHLKAVILFAGYTGWRKSEITGLTLRRVKIYDTGGVAILEDSKNNDGRMTTLPQTVINTLKSLPSWRTCKLCRLGKTHSDQQCNPVFTRAGKPIKDFKAGLRASYKRASLMHVYYEGKPFHRFRNFFRTNHADMGTDISIIMQEGGWKDPNMMMRYLNQRQAMRRRIAEKYSDYIEKGSARIFNLGRKAANEK
jgi:integrase